MAACATSSRLSGTSQRIALMTAISANKVKIGNLVSRARIRARAIVVQGKTSVQLGLLAAARGSFLLWLEHRGRTIDDYASPSCIHHSAHLRMRSYTRLFEKWETSASPRRTIVPMRFGGLGH